ncbi:myomegalin-like [Hippopotamus amphibius kiboko]|uniref:myomegalin-like n=1 Tax=Hippopotamus amphibius kiboko TaxID=575201 RepID=UPI0025991467|nr:myomegalin-like [Hippopotamus amphibius kiboko]
MGHIRALIPGNGPGRLRLAASGASAQVTGDRHSLWGCSPPCAPLPCASPSAECEAVTGFQKWPTFKTLKLAAEPYKRPEAGNVDGEPVGRAELRSQDPAAASVSGTRGASGLGARENRLLRPARSTWAGGAQVGDEPGVSPLAPGGQPVSGHRRPGPAAKRRSDRASATPPSGPPGSPGLQHKLALLQQQCEEKQQLFQSLQSELQIYEALNGNSKKGLKAYTWDACHQVPLGSDLSRLVAEIRALRGQLEQSIQVNNCLRLQLEQQLDGGASKASLSPSSVNQKFPNNTDPGNKQLLFQDSVASPPVRDVGMNSPVLVLPSSSSAASGSGTTTFNRTSELGLDASPVMKNPPKLEGDATDGSFANKHGRHVIGHVDDYSALRQQIEEGRLLVKKVASLMRSTCDFLGLEALGTEVMGSEAIHELRSSANALHHRLEESASILTMFWRAALPSSHGPALGGKVGESMKRELLELRTKLSRQESLLQSTAEHLKTANQQKESLEQFIFSQCEIPKGSSMHPSPVTLAFQEPSKKRSHQRSSKQQEGWAFPPFSQLPVC